jgi:hypothetical protein
LIDWKAAWESLKLEMKERLLPGIKRRNALILQSVYAAEHLTEGSLETVRDTAWELNRLGYPEEGFAGIVELVTHAAPQSELGQRAYELVLDYAPNLKGRYPELYFENTLAACLNIASGRSLEQKAAKIVGDAYTDYARVQPERARERLAGAIELMAHDGLLAETMRELLRSDQPARPWDQSVGTGRRRDQDPL